MPALSSLMNSDVICKRGCALLGSVSNVYFDENCRNIVYFGISRDEGDALLPYSAASSVKDAVMADDEFSLISPQDADLTPLLSSLVGKRVYTAGGKKKGEVEDVLFSRTGKVRSLTAEGTAYSPSSFLAFGDVLILKEGANGRKKPASFPKAEYDYPVRALAPPPSRRPDPSKGGDPTGYVALPVFPASGDEDEGFYPVAEAMKTPVSAGGEDFTPHRIIADYNFLLGRTLTADISSYSGEKLASKGERVTVETVETVRRHGKLMELTLSSK